MHTFVKEIVDHIRSGCQAIRVVTPEEARALQLLQVATARVTELDKEPMPLITWDGSRGFSDVEDGKPKDPVSALKAIVDPQRFRKKNILFVFKDFHAYLKEPVVQRTFRNLRETNMLSSDKMQRPLLMLTPSSALPLEVQRCFIDIDLNLPDDNELARIFEYVHSCVRNGKLKVESEIRRRIIVAMRGMTEPEAEEALAYAASVHQGFTQECADTVEQEKVKVLKGNGVLSYIPKTAIAAEADIGGYKEFKSFIQVRAHAYTEKAQELKLSLPKGIVLLGPPGCGKSSTSKIAARILGLPLVMMDFGAVFGSLVGESEAKMRATLNQVSSLGGCVLLVDDADKAFRNATNSAGDSGVTQRVFQQFLVWRSEYKGPVFVILTMNSTEGIPAELLRPGRFDAVMCALLPDAESRKEILRIHMRKRNINDTYTEDQWNQIAEATIKFAGAELEGALDESTYVAFANRATATPTFDELLDCINKTVPTAVRDKDTVDALIAYCESNKLRSVDAPRTAKEVPITKTRRALTAKD